ncbi:MAG: Sip1-related alpha-galactosidase, partial [Gemmatimonadota bacterium]|nr:Sip1-related alpha-galactosidase [Gemmatimonadota bacterium]
MNPVTRCLICLPAILLASCSGKEITDTLINVISPPWEIVGKDLEVDGLKVLTDLPEGVSVIRRRNTKAGVFLELQMSAHGAGMSQWRNFKIAGLDRMLTLDRFLPWWMSPAFATDEKDVPLDTQFLLWRRDDSRTGLLLPLIDKGYRMSVAGDSTGFKIIADNNCPDADTTSGKAPARLIGVYIAVGTDPYRVLDQAFAAVVSEMDIGRRRVKKEPPRWIEHLGWCTWNAFYHGVSHKKVLSGLRSLKKGGITPGFVILDDGWQEARAYGFLHEETWLTGLKENRKKFPDGLGVTVKKAKDDFGVQDFLVWQTLQGYWRGVDSLSRDMSKYQTYRSTGRSNRPLNKRTAEWVPLAYNTIRPESIADFFNDYHSWLAGQGVTGVKVDNQSHLEFMTYGLGPGPEVMGTYRRALEASVEKHFGPASVINCMSLGPDVIFQAATSMVTRNSNDFFPDKPESHCLHLVVNAYNSLMTAQLVQPDWDMFQSSHKWGAFHGSARAVSGGPVYISDKPGKHNFALLNKVALPDGRVLRCTDPALPTRDILFHNPLEEDILLKVFNFNTRANSCVLGAWNCRYEKGKKIELTDTLSIYLV